MAVIGHTDTRRCPSRSSSERLGRSHFWCGYVVGRSSETLSPSSHYDGCAKYFRQLSKRINNPPKPVAYPNSTHSHWPQPSPQLLAPLTLTYTRKHAGHTHIPAACRVRRHITVSVTLSTTPTPVPQLSHTSPTPLPQLPHSLCSHSLCSRPNLTSCLPPAPPSPPPLSLTSAQTLS